jgi:glycosyltransferase involved in cell wall biosynthesis
MASSIFISYDGLTDTLGQSQILPYLIGLTKNGHTISVLSVEKKERFNANRHIIEAICKENNITWHYLFFHTKPPILAKYYDLYCMEQMLLKLYKKEKYDILHCRSYLSASIGIKLKQNFGVKVLFDMRGFWVDERVDGGLWNINKYFYRLAYKRWKKKEAELIAKADHIISLTEAAKVEIKSWPTYSNAPITIIPCCADFNLFTPNSLSQQQEAKTLLGIANNSFVVSYLGSLGTWYLLNEKLALFKMLLNAKPDATFLILTPDNPNLVFDKLEAYAIPKTNLIIKSATRLQVPQFMKASDVSISFIKPAYSKIASSPTKLGEVLAMNIPAICNPIGDVEHIINNCNGGLIIPDFSNNSLQKAIDYMLNLNKNSSSINKDAVLSYYHLNGAIEKYNQVYLSI